MPLHPTPEHRGPLIHAARTLLATAALTLAAYAGAQEFTQIQPDKQLDPRAGQPRCATLANGEGARAYGTFIHTSQTAAQYKTENISPSSAYSPGAKRTPTLLDAYIDNVWAKKYKTMQAAVDDLYEMCLKSDVAADSDRLFKQR